MKLSHFQWLGLLIGGIACSSGPGGAGGFTTNGQQTGTPGNPNTPPGNPNAPPGGGTTPGSGGGGNGGTGNIGQGGTGETGGVGGGDCQSGCEGCGIPTDQCGTLCANATQEQLDCAAAALPDCAAAIQCFSTGSGGTGGGPPCLNSGESCFESSECCSFSCDIELGTCF